MINLLCRPRFDRRAMKYVHPDSWSRSPRLRSGGTAVRPLPFVPATETPPAIEPLQCHAAVHPRERNRRIRNPTAPLLAGHRGCAPRSWGIGASAVNTPAGALSPLWRLPPERRFGRVHRCRIARYESVPLTALMSFRLKRRPPFLSGDRTEGSCRNRPRGAFA